MKSTATKKEPRHGASFPLDFVPEDPSELSLSSVQTKIQGEEMLGNLHNSSGSLLPPDYLGDEGRGNMKKARDPKSQEGTNAEHRNQRRSSTSTKNKRDRASIRKTNSSSRLQNFEDKPRRSSMKTLSSSTDRRGLSRRQSTSCVDQARKYTEAAEDRAHSRSKSRSATKPYASKESSAKKSSADNATVNRVTRKKSKRALTTESDDRAAVPKTVEPPNEGPPKPENMKKRNSVKDRLSQSLSSLGLIDGGSTREFSQTQEKVEPTKDTKSQEALPTRSLRGLDVQDDHREFGHHEDEPLSQSKGTLKAKTTKRDKIREVFKRSLSDVGLGICHKDEGGRKSPGPPNADHPKRLNVRETLSRSFSDLGLNLSRDDQNGDKTSDKISGPVRAVSRNVSSCNVKESSSTLSFTPRNGPTNAEPLQRRNVREVFSRSLSDFGLDLSRDDENGDKISGPLRAVCRNISSCNAKESSKTLSFTPGNGPANAEPLKRRNVREVFSRSLSDFGLDLSRGNENGDKISGPPRVISRNASSCIAKEGKDSKKRSNAPIKTLESMRKVLGKGRKSASKQQSSTRIENTNLDPFEHHLTCNLWSDDAGIVAMALGKMSSLCVVEREESLKTLELVGSSSICGCLKKWHSDDHVTLQGLRLLSLTSYDISDRFVEGAIRCGLLEIVLNAMENAPCDQILLEYACGAVFSLVNTESSFPSKKFVVDLDALPTLLRPMMTFPTNAEIKKHVKSAFNSLKRFEELHSHLELGEPIIRMAMKTPSTAIDQEHPNDFCNISVVGGDEYL